MAFREKVWRDLIMSRSENKKQTITLPSQDRVNREYRRISWLKFAVGQQSETSFILRFLPNPLARRRHQKENVYTADSALDVHATCGARSPGDVEWEFPETRMEPSSLSDRRLSFGIPTFHACGGAMSLMEAGVILGLEPECWPKILLEIESQLM